MQATETFIYNDLGILKGDKVVFVKEHLPEEKGCKSTYKTYIHKPTRQTFHLYPKDYHKVE